MEMTPPTILRPDRPRPLPAKRDRVPTLVFAVSFGTLFLVQVVWFGHQAASHRRGAGASLPPATAVSVVLSAEDKATLLKEAEITQDAFNKSDFDTLIKHTPDVLFRWFGKDAVARGARESRSVANDTGIKYLAVEFREPTETYQTSTEVICFLPRTSVLQVQGRQIRSASYCVAVRENGKPLWKFIDGTAFKDDTRFLRKFFPELPGNLRLPEWNQVDCAPKSMDIAA
jgi:hypothetical protein